MSTLHDKTQARSYVEYIRTLGTTSGPELKAELAARLGPNSAFFERYQKASVAAISGLTNPELAYAPLGAAFLEPVRRTTILGRLTDTLPVPLNSRVALILAPVAGAWIGTGAPFPAARMTTNLFVMGRTSLGAIVPFSKEMFTFAGEAASRLLERQLSQAIRDFEDAALLSTDAAVDGLRPAGLLWNLVSVGVGSGVAISDQIQELWAEVRDGNADRPVFILSPSGAMYLAGLRDANGGALFPNIGPLGGSLYGVPAIIARAAGDHLVLLDASTLAVADDGLVIDRSERAAIQMTDTPTDGATALVSAFQTNSVFLRIQRLINWQLGVEDGVAFLTLPAGSPS